MRLVFSPALATARATEGTKRTGVDEGTILLQNPLSKSKRKSELGQILPTPKPPKVRDPEATPP
jgi:hypothetical protein